MRCLAVNAANQQLSIALVDDQRVVGFHATTETRNQGNILLAHVQSFLKDAGVSFDDLDVLGVVTGPGSFTGIRIGLAAMRGIALASKKPIIGLSSFDLHAVQDGKHANLIAIESWREELYFQVNDATGAVIVPPVNVTPNDLVPLLKNITQPLIVSGDAREKMLAVLPSASIADQSVDARNVAQKVMALYAAKGDVFEKPVPFYLREADITMPKAG